MLKKLKDECYIVMGQSPSSEFYNKNKDGIPFLQGRKTFGDKHPIIDTWTTKPLKIIIITFLIFFSSSSSKAHLRYISATINAPQHASESILSKGDLKLMNLRLILRNKSFNIALFIVYYPVYQPITPTMNNKPSTIMSTPNPM